MRPGLPSLKKRLTAKRASAIKKAQEKRKIQITKKSKKSNIKGSWVCLWHVDLSFQHMPVNQQRLLCVCGPGLEAGI